MPLSENNVEFPEEEHDFNSDADEGLEIKMLYLLIMYKNWTKQCIICEMPLHKYVGLFKILHFPLLFFLQKNLNVSHVLVWD